MCAVSFARGAKGLAMAMPLVARNQAPQSGRRFRSARASLTSKCMLPGCACMLANARRWRWIVVDRCLARSRFTVELMLT
eukprot:256035-Alexandrium_andersonii.AAC.1